MQGTSQFNEDFIKNYHEEGDQENILTLKIFI